MVNRKGIPVICNLHHLRAFFLEKQTADSLLMLQIIQIRLFNYWYRHLMQMPEFFELVKDRWNEVRDREIAMMLSRVRRTAFTHRADFERNFERHPIMGVPVISAPQDVLRIRTFEGHLDHLINWLETRIEWLDDFFNDRMPDYDPLVALFEYHRDISPINILLNGSRHTTELPLLNLQDRIMISASCAAGLLGYTKNFNPITGVLSFIRTSIVIRHEYGTDSYSVSYPSLVDNERITFGTPSSMFVGDYFYIPLRMIPDAMGYDISWNSGSRTVSIYTRE